MPKELETGIDKEFDAREGGADGAGGGGCKGGKKYGG